MHKNDTARVALRLFALLLLTLSLWMITASVAKTPQAEQHIPVKITTQLEAVSGVIPAEIYCGLAVVKPTGEVEFACKLRNNSRKKMTAGAVVYSVVIEKGGVETRDDYSSVFVNLVGPQFEGLDRPVGPGEEVSIGPPGPISYAGARIKGVEIGTEFVELEDSVILGQRDKGAQVVKDVREGATKYRGWIKGKYESGKKLGSAIAPLLESEDPLPTEAGLLNQNQEFGAKAYRRRLKKKSDAGGYAEFDKLLSR